MDRGCPSRLQALGVQEVGTSPNRQGQATLQGLDFGGGGGGGSFEELQLQNAAAAVVL